MAFQRIQSMYVSAIALFVILYTSTAEIAR